MARSTSVEMRVPSSSAWLLPATDAASSVRPRRSPLQGSRARQRTAVPIASVARSAGSRATTGRALSIQASTHGSLAIPCRASSWRTEVQTAERRAATSARRPGRSTSGPRRTVVAATSPAALPVARMRASSTARSRRARSPSMGRPINPARANRSPRVRSERVTDPFTARPLRCSRRASASHSRSSPGSSNVAMVRVPLTSRPGGAGGRPTGNARGPHPAPVARAGLRRSRGSAPRGSSPTCARSSSRSQGRVRSAT